VLPRVGSLFWPYFGRVSTVQLLAPEVDLSFFPFLPLYQYLGGKGVGDGMRSDGMKMLSCRITGRLSIGGNCGTDGWIQPITILPPAVAFNDMGE